MGRQKAVFQRRWRRETAGQARNAKRNGGFGTSFYGAISGYIFAAQVLTWRLRPPLLPKFLGTSPGVPNHSHGSAATACHSVSAVDFARQGRQYLACDNVSGGGKLNLSASGESIAVEPVLSRQRHETYHVSTNRKNCVVY
jgi:hypothetical protein